MKRSLLIRAAIGFLVGNAMGLLIAWMIRRNSAGIFPQPFLDRTGGIAVAWLVQCVVSGLYGAVCMAGTICYDVERWSLLRATLTHYLMIAVPYVPISLLMNWANSATEILIMEAFQLVGFFLIWLIMYLRYRAEVRKLNELNNQRKNEDRRKEKGAQHDGAADRKGPMIGRKRR